MRFGVNNVKEHLFYSTFEYPSLKLGGKRHPPKFGGYGLSGPPPFSTPPMASSEKKSLKSQFRTLTHRKCFFWEEPSMDQCQYKVKLWKNLLASMGNQHLSPNVKSLCTFEPQIWLEIITSREAKSTCFKGSQTSCTEIISGVFWPKFGRKRPHHVMNAAC